MLGAFHQVYKNKKASEEAIKSFRNIFPTSSYIVFSDGGDDFSDICKKYNCKYFHEEWNLGLRDHTHPSGIYGMTKEECLEWLRRFSVACSLCKEKHIIMMEDDVHIRGNFKVPFDWEFAGQAKIKNKIPTKLLNYLKETYNMKYNVDYYGTGGGSIFNIETFLKNYDTVTKIYQKEFNFIKEDLCRGFGWVDMWMMIYYFLSGKSYTHNNFLIEAVGGNYWKISNHPIVHHYKKYY